MSLRSDINLFPSQFRTQTLDLCLRIVGLFSESNESPVQMLVCRRQQELCLRYIGI